MVGCIEMTLPLVRTEGKDFAEGLTLNAQSFIELPTLKRASKSDIARKAEAAFELGDCLYFFAGHACPDFGDLVLSYSSDMADAEEGSATPFDTGGLSEGHIHADALDGGEPRAPYVRRHTTELQTWRSQAAGYLVEHFPSEAAYVAGAVPSRNDSSGRLQHPKNNDRRAWTWEVRIWRDHPIEHALLKAWVAADYFEGIRQALQNTASDASGRCADLIAAGRLVSAAPGDLVHPWAEQEMASWL
jgi:hypothetical protein